MITIDRILCPIDFSDFSRRALDHAVALARWYHSKVIVVHAIAPAVFAPAPAPAVLDPRIYADVDPAQLLGRVDRFARDAAAPDVTMESMLRADDPATGILRAADDTRADLIVLGTHGRSGFERLLLGSVTEKVLRKAACPVLTVPRQQPDAAPAAQVVFKRILCPIDFSSSALQALDFATALAQEGDADLCVLHVLPDEADALHDPEAAAGPARATLADYLGQRDARASQRLVDAVPADAAQYCRVEPVLERGKPWREIVRVAADRDADLIVMGVQGRGAADLLLFGSTTHHVIREAGCPVLTVRARPAGSGRAWQAASADARNDGQWPQHAHD